MFRIKQLREERGWSQRALALRIGANPKTVNFWENNQCEPTAGFIIALSNVFECSADYLLGREDDFGAVTVQRAIDFEEQKLLSIYAELSLRERVALMSFGEFLRDKKDR